VDAQTVRTTTYESRDFIVTNRRYISRILFESRDEIHSVTLLMVPSRTWAFHGDPSPFKHYCKSPAICLDIMKKLDVYLDKGHNLGMKLKGSTIVEFRYYE
jgi:hypothetical protein